VELIELLETSPAGNASLILTHQLIAARLNVGIGAAAPVDVARALDDTEAWIAANKDADGNSPMALPEGQLRPRRSSWPGRSTPSMKAALAPITASYSHQRGLVRANDERAPDGAGCHRGRAPAAPVTAVMTKVRSTSPTPRSVPVTARRTDTCTSGRRASHRCQASPGARAHPQQVSASVPLGSGGAAVGADAVVFLPAIISWQACVSLALADEARLWVADARCIRRMHLGPSLHQPQEVRHERRLADEAFVERPCK
jgi:hypothetical protein